MLKNVLTLIAISIATLFGMLPDSAFPESADFEYVKDPEGRRLGMAYDEGDGKIYVGELAKLKSGGYLFVRCGSGEKRLDEKRMKRHNRNCRGQFVPWMGAFDPLVKKEDDSYDNSESDSHDGFITVCSTSRRGYFCFHFPDDFSAVAKHLPEVDHWALEGDNPTLGVERQW